MNPLARDGSGFRARQRNRLAELAPGTWPESCANIQKRRPGSQCTRLDEAVDQLVHNLRLAEQAPEYGPQHLALYRDLRDLLYNTKEQQPVEGNNSSGLNGRGFLNPCSQELVNELWGQHCRRPRAQNGHPQSTTPQGNPFAFTDATTNHIPAIQNDQHDEATTELALGYDECLMRAQKEWARSPGSCGQDGELDMMAVLGAALSDWCSSYKSWHAGVGRRWALYSVMNDVEFVRRLSQLAPRRACHMKDAMLQGMTGQQVVDTIILPCTGMFSDSPSGAGYTGDKVWPASLLVCLVVWADYAGAADAKSSVGLRAWDIIAPWALALAFAHGVAADEIKASTVTLYGVKLGLFCPPPTCTCTEIWRSRGYDGGVHTAAAAIAMTRGVPYPEDARTLDLAATVMAIHDAIDCEADVINRTECNLILITTYKGFSIECCVDTVYATLALHWTATDVYGQFALSILQEQTGGSRWGGPAYAAEARASGGSNLWTNDLSVERLASVLQANILPTTTKLLSSARLGTSWHDIALHMSIIEILASPLSEDEHAREPAELEDILALSKGTFALICCASCAACNQSPKLKLGEWATTQGVDPSNRVMRVIQRIRSVVDGPLQTLRAWLKSDPRPDAIYRLTAEAFMAVTTESRCMVALLEGLIIEDALYHGSDVLSYCVGWVPFALRVE